MEVDYPEDEREAHELLDRYAELRRQHARVENVRTAADFVTLLLKKRLLSSPAAFANTLAPASQVAREAPPRRRPPVRTRCWPPGIAADEDVDDESG